MTGNKGKRLHVVITAGEASGDTLGARLIKMLKAHYDGPIIFSGVGGAQMQAEGLASLFPMEDLSLMGVAEILPKLPLVLRRINETAEAIRHQKPDIVITIDSPDFSFRVAKKVRQAQGRGPLMIHYVAPSVWAWRPERAAKVARLYDGLICLLPFEPAYFIAEGMSAAFTGHPAIEEIKGLPEGRAFRKAHDIPSDAYVLGAFFGSRGGEIKRTGRIMRDALLRALDHPEAPRSINIVAPTLPHLKDRVEALLNGMPRPVHVVTDRAEKWPGMASMDAAVAVSGTVGLELAVSRVPHSIIYKMNPLTWRILQRKATVKYAHLANILMDEEVVPEFIQDRCAPDVIAAAIIDRFNSNGYAATAQRTVFLGLLHRLAGAGKGTPSEQAARYVLSLFEEKKKGGP
jgi:lipid-A-disaccharide synthase